MIEEKIELLKQWRNWYWQAMLWNKAKNTELTQTHLGIADGLDFAIFLLRDGYRVLPEPLDGFEKYKYDEYPKEDNNGLEE